MTPEGARARWVEALRSGEFEQGAHRLGTRDHGQRTYCCLGVACVLFADEADLDLHWEESWDKTEALWVVERDGAREEDHLPDSIRTLLGLATDVGLLESGDRSLACENDSGVSFDEIANLIEDGKVETC